MSLHSARRDTGQCRGRCRIGRRLRDGGIGSIPSDNFLAHFSPESAVVCGYSGHPLGDYVRVRSIQAMLTYTCRWLHSHRRVVPRALLSSLGLVAVRVCLTAASPQNFLDYQCEPVHVQPVEYLTDIHQLGTSWMCVPCRTVQPNARSGRRPRAARLLATVIGAKSVQWPCAQRPGAVRCRVARGGLRRCSADRTCQCMVHMHAHPKAALVPCGERRVLVYTPFRRRGPCRSQPAISKAFPKH